MDRVSGLSVSPILRKPEDKIKTYIRILTETKGLPIMDGEVPLAGRSDRVNY